MNVLPQEIAGPPVWYLIHSVCKHLDASSLLPGQHEKLHLFMNLVLYFFPCPHCRFHGTEILKSIRPVPTEGNVFHWSVDFHNDVNRKIRKRIMTNKEADRLYSSSHQALDTKKLWKALKVLFYTLEQPVQNNNTKEWKQHQSRTTENTSLLLSLLAELWPVPEERRYFASLTVPEKEQDRFQYVIQVCHSIPSISALYPSAHLKQRLNLQNEFRLEAEALLSAAAVAAGTKEAKTKTKTRASASSNSSSSSTASAPLWLWIIVIVALVLVVYFALLSRSTEE